MKSTSSPGTLPSMSPGDMKLLPQTLFILIHQLLIVVSKWHNFLLGKSLVSDIYPMSCGKQFVNTLEDNICRGGAMDKLISDSAKNEISHKVNILRAYNINDWQSEPYHQNQNPAEWRYRTIKAQTNTIMNRTGAPAHC